MIKKYFTLLLWSLMSLYIGTNSSKAQNADSLSQKSFEFFNESVERDWNDSLRAITYAQGWLKKAKREKNFTQHALAYRVLFHKSGKNLRLAFADSILESAKKTSDKALIGSAYLTKGIALSNKFDPSRALDNYLLANNYISQTADAYLIHKVKYQIAQTKFFLGYYHEAIALFMECIAYYKDEDDRAYLNALHGLSLCYYSTGKLELCTATVNKGLAAGIEFENTEMAPYFRHAEGVNQFFKKNYQKSIALLLETIPHLERRKDFANLSIAHFYIGKSFWNNKKREIAVSHFKKIDTLFAQHQYLRPDLREAYELLIDYNKEKDDNKSEILYWTRLKEADQWINENYKYLSGKILKEYNTAAIVKGLQKAKTDLRIQKTITLLSVVLLSTALAYFIVRYYRSQRRYRKKFEELMSRNTSPEKIVEAKKSEKKLQLLPEVEEAIYNDLIKFEKNKKYLEKNMGRAKIAVALHTNQRYAAEIISHYRGKGTIDYITDLKLDYIVDRLKNDKKFRKYTNESLAQEAGFGSTQIFAKSFKAKYGMSTLYFISEIQKES